MSRPSSLASLLTLLALWSAGTTGAHAQAEPSDATPESRSIGPPAVDSVWLDDHSEPVFQRLPPPDGPFLFEELPAAQTPRIIDGGAGGNSPGNARRSPLIAQLSWIPSQDLKNASGSLAMNSQEIELAYPVHIGADGIWLATGGIQRLELSTSAAFPDSGLAVPDQLWDIQIGTMHIREMADGWRAGGMFRIGSPSDRPFAALRDLTVTLLGFLTVPSGERDAWSFSLFYSPTGQIIFPIPGIAYLWRPSPRFQADLGIPFSMEYRPTDSLTLTASYRPLNDIQVLVRQSLGEFWSLYGGYETVNETYWLADREDNRERTYVFDQRLTLGVQRKLGGQWSLDASAAYVFDRQIFLAEKFSGSRRDELLIDPGVAGTIQLLWTR
jgi:hypothetical protein